MKPTYTFKELVRNNCACVDHMICDCEDCKIEEQVTLALKEWLIQKRVAAEERFAKYDAYIIQDLIDKIEHKT